uniref:Protein PLASTID MOVEMENT IMPAIRED 1-RELATED 1 n=1 Tax=Cajanus cajan TaxID=3821 RepID=A0A151T5B9_CAJCA|nr:hypothetical protein KK1_016746 [Cajanus cajan]
MMLSRMEAGKKSGGGSGNPKKLLKDVETINKALYLDRSSSKSSLSSANSRSKFTGKPQLPDPKSKSKAIGDNNDEGVLKDKKSIWNWRPLRALSHIRNKRFNCSFYLQVHLIEGLPSTFDDASLAVYWKRRDGVLVTGPAKVIQSVAEFEEKLTYTCSVYGSRSGPHHSAKYEAKHFLLYASHLGVPELDLGKHRVDLTRLLPLTLEELEEEKSSGKWTTSFRLTGAAKGAVMNVSFGYVVVGDNASATRDSYSSPKAMASRQNNEVKDLHEVLPLSKTALASSIDILYKKFDEEKTMHVEPEHSVFQEKLETVKSDDNPLLDSGNENYEQCQGNEFFVVDKGIELSSNEPVKVEESVIKAPEDASTADTSCTGGILGSEDSIQHDFLDEANDSSKDQAAVEEFASKENGLDTNELLLLQELESALNCVSNLERVALDSPKPTEAKSEHKMTRSHSLDDVTESVASEFLSMLDLDRSPMGLNLQEEHRVEPPDVGSKHRAQMLEDLETEALMREWGFNERAFHHSPPKDCAGFGSPIHLPPEEPPILPPLDEGLGPFLQTKDGGFVRSMNPSLFKNSKSGGSLIMQVSNPVVVPAEMGSGIMEVLQCLASVGIEKLSMQAKELMPLEDITGKTMQQVAWEAMPAIEGAERQCHSQHHPITGQGSACVQRDLKGMPSGLKSGKLSSKSVANQTGSEFVSLEDLAPLAMDKIEALSMEGLRIQSGMSEEEAPSNIVAHDSVDSVDGIMSLSLTLDEWMRLDSEKRRGRGRKCGLLGNNFTVALMVQLRDPLRNYEPVGTPMLALIQVEREFMLPKQKIFNSVSEIRKNNDDDDENEIVAKVETKDTKKEEKGSEEKEEEGIPQFRITEVHVAGMKPEPQKKKLWGTSSQQQSGSRWLLANGMGKSNNKLSLMKSKAVSKSNAPVTTKVQPGDTLWSISSRIYGTRGKWKELAALNPHIRNPNVIIPNDTIRLS